jgi:hypothetical protein
MRAIVRRVCGSSLALIELVDHLDLKEGEAIHVFSEELLYDVGVVNETELDEALMEATAAVASAHAAVMQTLGPTAATVSGEPPGP